MIRKEWVNIVALVVFFLVAWSFVQSARLDDGGNVVIMYDAYGVPLQSVSSFVGIWLLPVATLLLYILLLGMAHVTVYKPHLDRFYEKFFGFKLIMILLLFALYLSLIFANQNIGNYADLLLVLITACGFWYIAHLFEHLKSDFFAPWIKGRSLVWEDTHHIGSWLFKICAVLVLISLIQPTLFVFFIAVPLFSLLIMILIYMYLIFKKEHHLR